MVVAQAAVPARRPPASGPSRHRGRVRRPPDPRPCDRFLGKAALRSAATILGADLEPDGIRVATLTIAGTIIAGTSFDPERIAERYWEVVRVDGPWQAESGLPASRRRLTDAAREGGALVLAEPLPRRQPGAQWCCTAGWWRDLQAVFFGRIRADRVGQPGRVPGRISAATSACIPGRGRCASAWLACHPGPRGSPVLQLAVADIDPTIEQPSIVGSIGGIQLGHVCLSAVQGHSGFRC